MAMQNFMREWSKLSARRNDAVLLDQAALPWFAELNRGLRDQLDEEAFRARIIEYTGLLEFAGDGNRRARLRAASVAR